MANTSSVYVAKKAATLSNPITTASVFLQSDNSSYAAFCGIPGAFAVGTSSLDGKAIHLRASGNVLGGSGGTSTFTPQIWYAAAARTAIAVASGTAVAGAASTALSATTNYPWMLDVTLHWSYASGLMGGAYWQSVAIASGLTTDTIVTNNALSSVDLSANGVGFIASALMGTSRTGCVVTLSEFILEVL
jgi:hypothetical protein